MRVDPNYISNLAAALNHMRQFGRIPLCGMIDIYNATDLPAGPGTACSRSS